MCLVGLLFALEFGVLSVLLAQVESAERQAQSEASARKVLANAQDLLTVVYDLGLYLYDSAWSDSAATSFDGLGKLTLRLRARWTALSADLSGAGQALPGDLEAMSAAAEEALFVLAHYEKQADRHDESRWHEFARLIYPRIKAPMVGMQDSLVSFLRGEEAKLAASSSPQERMTASLFLALSCGIAGSALAALALAYFFLKSVKTPLEVLHANCERLKSDRELLPPLAGRDELSVLDQAFHEMSSQLKENRDLRLGYARFFRERIAAPLVMVRQTLNELQSGKGELSSRAQHTVSLADRNLSRLSTIIADLTRLCEGGTGSIVLDLQAVDWKQVESAALEAVRPLAQARQISLESSGFISEAPGVIADRGRIEQVLINLLSNAIKYSPEGTRVVLSLRSTASEVEVSVKDHGRGIAKEKLASLFDPFAQVEASDGRRGTGTGLGLSICKEIIDLHKGELKVESEPGVGSRFFFTLPLAPAEPDTTIDTISGSRS